MPHKTESFKEFQRVLKNNAVLTFDDHHMEENEIIETLSAEGGKRLRI